jgi:hypothetical protein
MEVVKNSGDAGLGGRGRGRGDVRCGRDLGLLLVWVERPGQEPGLAHFAGCGPFDRSCLEMGRPVISITNNWENSAVPKSMTKSSTGKNATGPGMRECTLRQLLAGLLLCDALSFESSLHFVVDSACCSPPSKMRSFPDVFSSHLPIHSSSGNVNNQDDCERMISICLLNSQRARPLEIKWPHSNPAFDSIWFQRSVSDAFCS